MMLVLTEAGSPRLTYTDFDADRMVYVECNSTCNQAANWVGGAAETPVAPVSPCFLAAWFPGQNPDLVLDSADRGYFGYDAEHLQAGACDVYTDIYLVRFTMLGGGGNPPSNQLYLPLVLR